MPRFDTPRSPACAAGQSQAKLLVQPVARFGETRLKWWAGFSETRKGVAVAVMRGPPVSEKPGYRWLLRNGKLRRRRGGKIDAIGRVMNLDKIQALIRNSRTASSSGNCRTGRRLARCASSLGVPPIPCRVRFCNAGSLNATIWSAAQSLQAVGGFLETRGCGRESKPQR